LGSEEEEEEDESLSSITDGISFDEFGGVESESRVIVFAEEE
jgi:hypothetical protein